MDAPNSRMPIGAKHWRQSPVTTRDRLERLQATCDTLRGERQLAAQALDIARICLLLLQGQMAQGAQGAKGGSGPQSEPMTSGPLKERALKMVGRLQGLLTFVGALHKAWPIISWTCQACGATWAAKQL